MKILALVALLVVGFIGLAYITPATQNIVMEREEVTHVEVEETQEVVDPIEAARLELERISNELDVQEQAQLAARASTTEQYEAAIAALKAQHEADIARIDAELDRIRETRVGFQ